jgi:hypothetical protein
MGDMDHLLRSMILDKKATAKEELQTMAHAGKIAAVNNSDACWY